MAYFSRLTFSFFLFLSSSAFAYDRVVSEPSQFGVSRSSTVSVYVTSTGEVVFSTTIGAGVYRCDDSLWGSDPAPNKSKACGLTYSQCPSPTVENPETGVCEEPDDESMCPETGTTEGDSSNAYETNSKVPANDICIGQCSWSSGGVVPSVCANGKCYYFGPFTSNGRACSGQGSGGEPPGDPEPAPPGDAQCVAKGQCPGTINGTKVCVPCSSKEGSTSESGSSSGSGTDSSGNPTGDTGTTNTTKETTANCTNGSCNTTTTTTVTNPDGSTTTTTETESKPQPDFCKANPGHIVCKGEDEGTFGGSCASGFQCSGDAVQCAQARASWTTACSLDVSGMSEQIAAGKAAMAAGAASGLGLPNFSDNFNLSSKLSEIPLFGSSGGCPSDISVSVGDRAYSLPFSRMCPLLNMLGIALIAFAYFISAVIVFRGGTQ